MFAVIEVGGRQYTVAPKTHVRVEKLEGQPGDPLIIDKVLLFKDADSSESILIGAPYVSTVRVHAFIEEVRRQRKIVVFKKKRRKHYRRRNGHRQSETILYITDIAKTVS